MVKNLEITVRTRTEMKMWLNIESGLIKGLLLGLRQFVTAESPLKMMKNAFHFMLRAILVTEMFRFLS